MTFNLLFGLMLVSFSLAACITYYLSSPTSSLRILQAPNERSLHQRSTPVGGGLGVLMGFIVTTAIVLWYLNEVAVVIWILAGMTCIAFISWLDDRHEIPALPRFTVHLLAAIILLVGGDLWLTTWQIADWEWTFIGGFSVAVSLLFVIWMTNLYNFMDGMDGLAGGMTVFGFGALAMLGGLAGDELFMSLNVLVASAAAGFLLFNFPPAKIFMGDVGSSSLGFLAAGMCLWGQQRELFPLWIGLLAFSPFIIDSTLTLLRRLLQGEKIWQAHRSHYYQQLVQRYYGEHRPVLFGQYILMAACSSSALLASQLSESSQWWLVSIWAGVYVALLHWSHRQCDRIRTVQHQISIASPPSRPSSFP